MAGIYRNQTEGIISLSSDGTTRITIADKNLGATQVYNDGDTLSEANAGKYYQWGNNYGFPFTGSVTTSSTQVNAQNYGPGNYYNSSTFIIRPSSPYSWDSSDNRNLRGGVTGTVEAMQGPCDTGFHIPTKDENVALCGILINGLGLAQDGSTASTYLKMPYSGRRKIADGDTQLVGTTGGYRSSTAADNTTGAYNMSIGDETLGGDYGTNRPMGQPIRPFKNEPEIPYANEGWTKLYGDDLPPRPATTPTINRFIKNGNYFYFGDAPIHISGIALDKNSISLTTVGQTEQLTATISPEGAVETNIVWSSSDENVATVDSNGLVAYIGRGNCVITASCGGITSVCNVRCYGRDDLLLADENELLLENENTLLVFN